MLGADVHPVTPATSIADTPEPTTVAVKTACERRRGQAERRGREGLSSWDDTRHCGSRLAWPARSALPPIQAPTQFELSPAVKTTAGGLLGSYPLPPAVTVPHAMEESAAVNVQVAVA